ncbi:MAG TPA: hypothetical protein VFE50_11895 [Cyclobacteriaceae bacterium]|nr:hypothetical protein [Cyclobacteriaceae bacterium]
MLLRSITLFAIGCLASSCATVIHGWNHKFTSPVYIGDRSGKVFVEGKEFDIKSVVSGADVKTKHNNYYTYSTTVTTTTLYFDEAVLVFPKQKYVTVEIRDTDDVTVLESYLFRRDPRYAFFALNFFIGAGVGSIVDLGDNLAYDWELVAYRKFN